MVMIASDDFILVWQFYASLNKVEEFDAGAGIITLKLLFLRAPLTSKSCKSCSSEWFTSVYFESSWLNKHYSRLLSTGAPRRKTPAAAPCY